MQCFVIFPYNLSQFPSPWRPLPLFFLSSSRPRFHLPEVGKPGSHLPVPLLNMREQNVKAQPEILNILSNARVFIVVEKRMVRILELAPLFLLGKRTYGTKN